MTARWRLVTNAEPGWGGGRAHQRANPSALCGFILSVGCASCLASAQPVRLAERTMLAVAMVLDSARLPESSAVPASVAQAVGETLAERNIQMRAVGDLSQFQQTRDSGRRLASLEPAPGDAGVLLVELSALFYSQLNGRYRWTVQARLSLRVGEEAPLQRETSLPALLQYDHEGPEDAVRAVETSLAREVRALVDSVFAGAPKAQTRGPIGQSIYFVLVDRFQNGDPANDGHVDRADPQAWHGGDLQGVIDRLDDLKTLGVDTVWLSPVLESQDEPFFGNGAFHGYWIDSFDTIDARFGDTAKLVELADALHARGMHLVLDWVVNHVGYTSPLVTQHPDWIHGLGSIGDWSNAQEVETHDVHGLPDLAQEREPVYAHLLESARHWLDTVPVDGLRMDAVKHVPLAFWSRYNADLQAVAPRLTLLGEHYDGAPSALATVQRQGGFTHVFDFPLAFALRDVFCAGASAGKLGAVLSDDRLYDDATRLVTFVDNHDMARVQTACGSDQARVRAVLTALLALRGTPALMYGTEAGLAGASEAEARADMVFADGPLRAHLAALLRLRRDHPALRSGLTRVVLFADDVLGLLRLGDSEAALLLINGATTTRTPRLPELLAQGFFEALTGASGGPTLAAHGTWLGLSSDSAEVLWQHYGRTPLRAITLQVGDDVALLGSGPELGHWQAPGLVAKDGSVRLQLPASHLFAFKLARRRADGTLRWEERGDRYLYVDRDETITLAWEQS